MVDLEGTLRASLGGRYHIEEEIGRGGMSVVYRAHDLRHNRSVAIKVLKPELSEQIGSERFQREIEVVAGLTHPHILPLHDSGEADGLLYYVMPFVQGGSLRHRIESEGALPEADALRIAGEIADALAHAHAHDVIHRDVKPGNILLSGDHALLADFGIAHLADDVLETLTAEGIALGTPAYLSPEQASGVTDIDGRSDIYSLGCVLYEALTGSPPFSGDSVRAMILHQIVDTPTSVRSLNERVSPAAEAIVDTALRKEPRERFQSGEEMAEALATVGAGIWGLPALLFRQLGLPNRHANRAALVATAVAVVACAVFLFALQNRRSPVEAALPVTEARYVVLEYAAVDASDEEMQLAREAARLLRDRLRDWGSVYVVSEAAMEGPKAEVFAAGVVPASHALETDIAERFDADFRVRVQVRDLLWDRSSSGDNDEARSNARDEIRVEATVFRVPEERPFRTYPAAGSIDSLPSLVTEIALELLSLGGSASDWEALLQRSSDHRAVAAYDTARVALHAWRLAEAHRLLERAIEHDSTFALAHHLLAQTMYWELARQGERLFELGPRIAYHAHKADRFGDGRLRPRERSSVNAFNVFWSGDYDSARVLYDTLIAREPSDLESLVMRGAVEVEDPIAVPDSTGRLSPRRNLNVAIRMFDTATTLNPDWDLSWGHLVAIVLEVGKIAWRGQAGLGFEPPDAEPVTPYERSRDTEEQLWYCPVIEADTIAWREVTIDGCPLDSAARQGASRLYSETVDRVFDWMTGIGLDRPRHHVQLADLLLEERERIGCEGDQVRADSLLDAAQAHFERALEMLADTTPQQRVSLANLYLARSDLERALGQAERALAELPDWEQPGSGVPPPLAAANPFLAAGQPETAARIVARIWSENTASFPHPLDPDRTIRAQGQYARLQSLEGLGFAAEAGPEIAQRLSRVLGAWRDAPIPERDRAALRHATLDIVGPALVHAPELWEDWFADWDRYALELPPVWKGFLALSETPPNRTEAVVRLDESIAALNARGADSDRVSAADFYLPLLLARAVGATDTETDLLQRLSRCMLQLDMYDPVWGAFGSLGLIEK